MASIDAATLTKQLNAQALATHSNRVAPPRGLLQEWLTRWKVWRRIRRDEAFLRRQPRYLLEDIGLERSEIGTTLRQGRYL